MTNNNYEHSLEIAHEELQTQFYEWLQKQPDDKKNNSEYYHEKLSELKDGLDLYLENSDTVQEELIKLNAKAATTVMLAEAILVKCDQNNNIKSLEDTKSTINNIFDIFTGDSNNAKIKDEQISDIYNLIQETQTNKSRKASKDLRKYIEDTILEIDITVPTPSKETIELFQNSRIAQTNAVNEYQEQLAAIAIIIKDQDNNLETEQSIFNKDYYLLHEINQRFKQVESFRNGIVRSIPKQQTRLTSANIQDLTDNYRNQSGKTHPLIANATNTGRKLLYLIDNASNPLYRKDILGVKIKENGIKSWKRTIHKLFNEKGANWNYMRDNSRINPVFSSAESMYFYNKAIHKLAPDLGWQIHERDENIGPRMFNSGTINWHMTLQRTKEPGNNLFAEIKLDPLSISKTEALAHPLYTIARKINNGQRDKESTDITDNKTFIKLLSNEINSTIVTLTANKKLLDESIIKQLTNIQTLSQELTNKPHLLNIVQEMVVDAEAAIRFEAARNESSPSMAALFKTQFDKLTNKIQTKIDADNPNSTYLIARKARLDGAFNKNGPKIKSEDNKLHGQYAEEDLNLVNQLQTELEETLSSKKKDKLGR